MPELSVSDDTLAILRAFKPLVAVEIEEDLDDESLADLVIQQGVMSMIRDLLGPQEHETLVTSFLQMALRYPDQVFQFMTDVLQRGSKQQDEAARNTWIGFVKSR